jgi:hypothetical protein
VNEAETQLRAERRWGELLGEAEIGRPAGNVTAGNVSTERDRIARHRARQVSAVPEEVFEHYLATVNEAETQLRAERRWGELLGEAENRGPATVTASDGCSRDRMARHRARQVSAVPEEVFERSRQGRTPTAAPSLSGVPATLAHMRLYDRLSQCSRRVM